MCDSALCAKLKGPVSHYKISMNPGDMCSPRRGGPCALLKAWHTGRGRLWSCMLYVSRLLLCCLHLHCEFSVTWMPTNFCVCVCAKMWVIRVYTPFLQRKYCSVGPLCVVGGSHAIHAHHRRSINIHDMHGYPWTSLRMPMYLHPSP